MIEDMKPMLVKVREEFEVKPIEFDREHDHAHRLIHYPPNVSISSSVNRLKGVSS